MKSPSSGVPWLVLFSLGALGLLMYSRTRQQKEVAPDLNGPWGEMISRLDEAVEASQECQAKFGAAKRNMKELKGWATGE